MPCQSKISSTHAHAEYLKPYQLHQWKHTCMKMFMYHAKLCAYVRMQSCVLKSGDQQRETSTSSHGQTSTSPQHILVQSRPCFKLQAVCTHTHTPGPSRSFQQLCATMEFSDSDSVVACSLLTCSAFPCALSFS